MDYIDTRRTSRGRFNYSLSRDQRDYIISPGPNCIDYPEYSE